MIATAASWKRQPFGEVRSLPYEARFDPPACERLRAGLVPEEMEDKWFVYHEGGSLFFHASWTGQGIFRVDLADDGDGGAQVVGAFCARDVLERSAGGPDHEARVLGFLVSNLLLGRSEPYPLPPGKKPGPRASLRQHVVAGTAYAEAAGPAVRPWWRRVLGL